MSVWKQFGTLEDFKEFAHEAKKRNIDIIMDIVLNHVSSDHIWFKKACESSENTEHNYFIWRDKLSEDEKAADSIFGGSAWEFIPSVNKYYFHLFAKEQVDLNWDHDDTINAMANVIDFWYNLGVKGFRLDAIKHISKVFPDGNTNAFSWGPTVVPQLQKFNEKAFRNKEDAFIFGEASGATVKEMIQYGTGKEKVSSNYFNFSWWAIGWGKTGRNGYNANWNYLDFVKNMTDFQSNDLITPELMTNFLSNYDCARAVSRWGNEKTFWKESVKTFALMLFSLKGIPCIYYGEEIGMLNPGFKNRSEFRDVDALNAYSIFVDKQKHYTENEMTKYHSINGRDNSRTPMQWNNKINAGFNIGGNPWIKVGDTYKDINVDNQINDETSILNFYKDIIKLRKSEKYKNILVDGKSIFEITENGLFKITRLLGSQKLICFINIRDGEFKYEIPSKNILVRSWSDGKTINSKLRSYESILFDASSSN